MRRNDQAVELVVGVVGEREHHPVLSALAGTHFDAADDAVGARRGGDLNAIAGASPRTLTASIAFAGCAAARIMRPSARGARHLIRRNVSSPRSQLTTA